MKFLTGTFSLNMLKGEPDSALIRVESINSTDIPLDVKCCISHENLLGIVENITGRKFKREKDSQVLIEPGDVLYVARYKGPKLFPNTTCMPKGATVSFAKVTWEQAKNP